MYQYDDTKKIEEEVAEEFRNIASHTQYPVQELIKMEVSHAAPNKVEDGMITYADGTDWNPGSGEGIYCYYNSTWNYLG